MNLFRADLQWDSISIMQQAMKVLKEKNFSDWNGSELFPNFALSDSGNDAFIIQAYKNKKALRIILQNQEQKIIISTGTKGQKEVSNIKTKSFNTSDILEAGNYFEKLIKC